MINDEIRQAAEEVLWKMLALQHGAGASNKMVNSIVELILQDRVRRDEELYAKLGELICRKCGNSIKDQFAKIIAELHPQYGKTNPLQGNGQK